MRLTEPTDREKDVAVGRFMPRVVTPWNTFTDDEVETSRLELKSEGVLLGMERFTNDEMQKLLVRMVRGG